MLYAAALYAVTTVTTPSCSGTATQTRFERMELFFFRLRFAAMNDDC